MFHGKIIGQKIIRLEEVDSTNSYGLEMIRKGDAVEGDIIQANYQKEGKGQNETIWESERGKNLLISAILSPTAFPATLHFHLNRCIALAVCDFIQNLIPIPATIKWPNDIMAGDKKIAGMLTQNQIRQNHIHWSVVGIGINVNQKKFNVYSPQATSVINITGVEANLQQLTTQLSESLEKWYILFKFERYEKIRESYQTTLYKFGTRSRFEDASGKFTGEIKGVLEDGRLIIEDELKKLRLYSNKEISFIF